MKHLKTSRSLALAGLFAAVVFVGTSCNQATTTETDITATDTATATDSIVEEDAWLIDEHQINQVPITTLAKTPDAKNISSKHVAKEKPVGKTSKKSAITSDTALAPVGGDNYDIASATEMNSMLNAQEYIAVDTITAAESVVPLDETQTAVAYNKKGKDEGELQVVSDADGNVEQVIFTNKKHHDVYNVEAGMSAKEVKKLRRDMKHMMNKGKVFLYNDDSNVMYMMDATDTQGNEVTAESIDDMNVQAVIWKDKKHHKKSS